MTVGPTDSLKQFSILRTHSYSTLFNMLQRFILSVLLGTVPCSAAFAQKETNNWLFGHQCGFTFLNGTLADLPEAKIRQPEGASSISDPQSGKLILYSDGQTIWDRYHRPVKNGTGLYGSATSTQSALIIPYPGNSTQYIVFTVRAGNEKKDGLHYSLVAVSDSTVLPYVGQKNVFLDSKTTEKLTAIRHSNGIDYWIISHLADSNAFVVFLLDSKGVTAKNRINAGSKHRSGSTENSGSMGYLKASPDGKLIAAAVYGKSLPFEIFDFDDRTGIISRPRSLGNFNGQYGVSFSPDNTKLYLTGLYPRDGAYRFDLTQEGFPREPIYAPSHSRPSDKSAYLSGAMQLGPDGKLYVSMMQENPRDTARLAVIERPNMKIADAGVTQVALPSAKSNLLFGLPNFMQHYFNRPSEIYEETAPDIILHPNPAFDSYIKISSTLPIELSHVTVFNEDGRPITPVFGKKLSDNVLIIDTQSWEKTQTYLIQVTYGLHRAIKRSYRL
jgi:hypothetical protein